MMIYQQSVNTQAVCLERWGYFHPCRTSNPIDRCCSCSYIPCPHKGSKCKARASFYIYNSGPLLAASQQTWSESFSLYAHTSEIYLDITLLEEFLFNGITPLDLKTLLEHEAYIFVTLDLETLLSAPRGTFENLLTTWAVQRMEDSSPTKYFPISFDIRTHRRNIGRSLRHSLLVRAGWDILRMLFRLSPRQNPEQVTAEILRILYGAQRSSRYGPPGKPYPHCANEVFELLWAIDIILIARDDADFLKYFLGFFFDMVICSVIIALVTYWFWVGNSRLGWKVGCEIATILGAFALGRHHLSFA